VPLDPDQQPPPQELLRRIRLVPRPVPTPEDLPPQEVQARTFRWDLTRGALFGVYETATITLAMLVAIRYFEAPDAVKSVIPATLGLGFLLSPLTLMLFQRIGTRLSYLLTAVWLICAFCFGLTVFTTSAVAFVVGIGLAKMCGPQSAQLQTQLYSSNYLPKERGSRLSTAFLVTALSSILAGTAAGALLDLDLSYWRWIFAFTTLCLVAMALTFTRIPSPVMGSLQAGDLRSNLLLPLQDRLFGAMLVAWMFMGLGNLMMIPLRVEYLANPAYGINASNETVSLLLISVVSIARLLSTKLWGAAFDRFNFITVRCLLNLTFMASIVVFFSSDRLWQIGIGAGLLGIAFGGGGVMWTLWVTKVAPPDKVSAYMSMHGFTTGLRMTAAPFIGYAAINLGNPQIAGLIAVCLIAFATLIFLRLRPLLQDKEAKEAA